MHPRDMEWLALLRSAVDGLHTVHLWDDLHSEPTHLDHRHLHPEPALGLTLRGLVRNFGPDGQGLDFIPGTAGVIAPGVWHGHDNFYRDTVGVGIGPCGDRIYLWFNDTDRGLIATTRTADATSLYHAAREEDATTRLGMIQDLLRDVLTDELDFMRPGVYMNLPETRMVHRLWSEFHQGLTVDRLLQASGLGRSQAYELFTRHVGIPPKVAIDRYRCAHAERLLHYGSSIYQAAQASGFSSTQALRRSRQRSASDSYAVIPR